MSIAGGSKANSPNQRHWAIARGTRWLVLITFAILALPASLSGQSIDQCDAAGENLRLNQIQVIGTHNSYHLEPHASTLQLIAGTSSAMAQSLQYSHRPLDEQFSTLGIRQIELDVYSDPNGGHYADPKAPKLAKELGLAAPPAFDTDGTLRRPGFKVLHVPDFDYLSTFLTLKDALTDVKRWSEAHPRHLPILILLELKEDQPTPLVTKPMPFDSEALDALDGEIRQVFAGEHLLTPDTVRGDSETLRTAVVQRGWPRIQACRGRVMFALDNGGALRDAYLSNHPSLEGRVMFTHVDAEHPAAAFMKINDPISDFEEIQSAVKSGFLVRTRADADTREARENDYRRAERALESGAQFISTDYPEPDPRLSDYRVRLPNQATARSNPLNTAMPTVYFASRTPVQPNAQDE